jgi:hypothetical protein
MIHVQNKKADTAHNEFASINERYQDFLKFALHRIIETALLYESQAKASKNPDSKLFLYFLAGKKRVQHVILEMVASNKCAVRNSGIDFYSSQPVVEDQRSLAESKPELIMKYAHDRAEKDLNLFSSLAALEEDVHTRKLLLTLSKMAKDFIQDINVGYTKFTANQMSVKSLTTATSIYMNTKMREEFPVR